MSKCFAPYVEIRHVPTVVITIHSGTLLKSLGGLMRQLLYRKRSGINKYEKISLNPGSKFQKDEQDSEWHIHKYWLVVIQEQAQYYKYRTH